MLISFGLIVAVNFASAADLGIVVEIRLCGDGQSAQKGFIVHSP